MTDIPLMRRLREMILSGALAPGQRVTEAGLADLLGVSRTPIRNALPTLAAEGLVRNVGRRGYAVREFNEHESWEALELRALLEGQAARMVAQKGASEALLIDLEDCLASGDALFEKRHLNPADEVAYGIMNARFHQLVIDACESAMLRTFIERLNIVPFVAPSVVVFDQIGLDRAYDLLFGAHRVHHAIVDAIRDGDGQRAETLFREHAHQQKFSMFERSRKRRAISSPQL